MANNIQGTSHQAISLFFNRNCKSEGNGIIYLKGWKGRIYNQEYSTQKDSHSDLMEKLKYKLLSALKDLQMYKIWCLDFIP